MEKRKALASILMVDPEFFDIKYAINPHMMDSSGQLQKVDKKKARMQWENIVQTFSRYGAEVHVIKGDENLPDMVFAANQSWPFIHPENGKPSVLMGQMSSEFRKPEVAYFEKYFEQMEFTIYHLENPNTKFEGNGDALIQPGCDVVWCGVGPRTEEAAYTEIASRFGFETVLLNLKDPNFYHLDTCFSILSNDAVAIVEGVFSKAEEDVIESQFSTVIRIPYEEGLTGFAANGFCFDAEHVFLNPGNEEYEENLREHGFIPVELETSEFIKSGGSVFCLKMLLPSQVV